MSKMNTIRNIAVLAVLSINFITTIASNNQSNLLKKKPNVLILFSDQHHKKVMGFEGHPDVLTP
jgi:arylsulfatase